MAFLMFKATLLPSSIWIGRSNEFLKPILLPLSSRLYSTDGKRQKQDLAREKKLAKKLARAAAEPPVPEYINARSTIWKNLKLKYYEELAIKDELPLKVTLPDGKIIDGFQWKTTPFDVAKNISNSLASKTYVAKVNNELWDLERPLEADCKIELLKFDAPDAKAALWVTTAFSLAEVLERVYGVAAGGLLCNVSSSPTGFFADIHLNDVKLTNADIVTIEEGLKKMFSRNRAKVERIEASKSDLLELFAYNQFKIRTINDGPNERIPVYRCGNYIDVSNTPLMRHNKKVKAFKVLKFESVESVQRVHGISFPSESELNNFIKEGKL